MYLFFQQVSARTESTDLIS